MSKNTDEVDLTKTLRAKVLWVILLVVILSSAFIAVGEPLAKAAGVPLPFVG